MNKSYKYLLMLGHICTDINQGALPAILPFLIASRGIGYASAAGLVFAANLVSTVIQPVFGYLGDKGSRPWLMSLGIALAGSGMALIGFCRSYWTVCLAAAVTGFGVALFHPEGGKTANLISGEKKGTGISIFSVGGNIGLALGPILTSTALFHWGLKGTVVFLIPTYLMAALLLFLSRQKIAAPTGLEKKAAEHKSIQPDDWASFARVAIVIIFRSIVQSGLMTFIPLYWIGVFLQSEVAASARLTLFSMVGAVAILLGGRIADRYGFQRIIRIGFCALAPLLLLFLQIKDSFAATLLVIPIAVAMSGPYSTLVAMGQSCLPNHIGFASGITLGLAVSAGGVCAPLIGWIGDTYGLTASMYTITGAAFLALFLSFFIPKGRDEIKYREDPYAAVETAK